MWRSVAAIVLAGTALGVAYNGAGLMSRPVRGIPWIAVGGEMPTLESLAPPEATMGADPQPAVPPLTQPASKPEARKPQTPVLQPPPAAPVAVLTAPPDTQPAAPAPFIPEVGRPIQIKLATAKSLFEAKAALFIDARDPSEFEEGHIPGAIRMMRDDALGDPERVKALGSLTHPIVTYCVGSTCESSLELAQVLVDAGYRKVLVYTGGFPEWAASGYPVARGGENR